VQVIDDARDRFMALRKEAARRADDSASYIHALTREAARRADGGAQYALEQARTQKVSWTIVAGALGVGFVTAYALLNSKKAAVATTTAMSGDWLEVLTAERRRIERLFKQIEATSDNQTVRRARLLEALNSTLTRHALQKENVIYPALRGSDHGASSTPLAAELFEIKTYLFELEATPKNDGRWIRKLKALQLLVEEHNAAEETVFPAFHQSLSPAEQVRLTRSMNREAMKLA
jgi:hemerythrin superfamily protein